MKKVLSLVVALWVLVSLSACNLDLNKSNSSTWSQSTWTTVETTETTVDTSNKNDVKEENAVDTNKNTTTTWSEKEENATD